MHSTNQRFKSIPIKIPYYITGFADGEARFNISFRNNDDFLLGWKISPVFNISQKEKTILSLIKHHLGCRTISFRKDNIWVYQVNNIKSIKEFFLSLTDSVFSQFLRTKKKDFARKKKIVEIKEKKSLTYNDIERVLQLLTEVESENSRKYKDCEIKERKKKLFWRRNQKKIELLNTHSHSL